MTAPLAEALAKQQMERDYAPDLTWDACNAEADRGDGDAWNTIREARENAADDLKLILDAIAEPSDAMIERGAEEVSGNDEFAAFDFPGEAIRVWRAMFAALRKEIEG